jgi:hypothetical protein
VYTTVRVAVATALLTLSAPAVASAALPTAVSDLAEGAVPGSDGVGTLLTPTDAEFSVGSTAGSVALTVLDHGVTRRWEFIAPDGETLRPGVYDGARERGARGTGTGFSIINGTTRVCPAGRFEIKDLARDAAGAVTRLWAVYQTRCSTDGSGSFGEVRFGQPPEPRAASSSPAILRWPEGDVGVARSALPVTLVASAPVQLPAASLSETPAFAIARDECAGQALAPGGRCQVWVRYTAAVAGTAEATLRVGDAQTTLQGFARAGRNRITLQSDPGDFIGQGGSWTHTPGDAQTDWEVFGAPDEVEFAVHGPSANWRASFVPRPSVALAPGFDSGRLGEPPNEFWSGFELTGNGRSCGSRRSWSATIHRASFDANGFLTAFTADFAQHCDEAPPGLRGRVEFREGDATTPAPWMLGGSTPATPGAAGPRQQATTKAKARRTPGRQRRATILRRGVLVRGTATKDRTRIALTLTRRTARALRLRSRVVGGATVRTAGAFSRRVRLKPSAARALRKSRRAPTISISVGGTAAGKVAMFRR